MEDGIYKAFYLGMGTVRNVEGPRCTEEEEAESLTTEAETGVRRPQVKFWQPPEAGGGEAWIPETLEGGQPLPYLDFILLILTSDF